MDSLHSGGRRWVPIHDSAVAKVPGYSVFDEGTLANIWIKEATGGPYIGQVRVSQLERAPKTLCDVSHLGLQEVVPGTSGCSHASRLTHQSNMPLAHAVCCLLRM